MYHLSTEEILHHPLTEEYGVAVADTSTVVTGWSLRHLAGSAAPPRGAAMPAAPHRPQSLSRLQYGAGSSFWRNPFIK